MNNIGDNAYTYTYIFMCTYNVGNIRKHIRHEQEEFHIIIKTYDENIMYC